MMEDRDFTIALQKHLRKSELEFRAKSRPRGSEVDWLEPECDSVESIARFLKFLGFRIKEIMDDEVSANEKFRWVITTSGIRMSWICGKSSKIKRPHGTDTP